MRRRAAALYRLVDRHKARLIATALVTHGGSRTRAAEALGITRPYLARMIHSFTARGIWPDTSRRAETLLDRTAFALMPARELMHVLDVLGDELAARQYWRAAGFAHEAMRALELEPKDPRPPHEVE